MNVDIPAWILARRSVRRFRSEPVPRALIERCAAAAGYAPSASNRQDWRFHAIDRPERLRAFDDDLHAAVVARIASASASKEDSAAREMADAEWRGILGGFRWGDAPVAVAVSCKPPPALLVAGRSAEEAMALSGSFASAAMAAQNFMLAATDAGLGTCCFTAPLAVPDIIRGHFDVPARRALVCLIAVGIPDESPASPPRRPVEAILRYVEARHGSR